VRFRGGHAGGNAERGNLDVIVEANRLGMMRTGAAGGVAAKWLAREDAKVVGIFGSGWQAQGQLEALAEVRRLESVKVYSRSPEKVAKFCDKMRQKLSLDVVPAKSPEDAVRASDIVVTITTSATPVFDGEWLAPGTHLDLIGGFTPAMREADDACFAGADVWIDTDEALAKAGDLLHPIASGVLRRADVRGTLADLCAGRAGPRAATARTVFKSVGTALEDLAAAILVYESR